MIEALTNSAMPPPHEVTLLINIMNKDFSLPFFFENAFETLS
jgi:hypothetical protein